MKAKTISLLLFGLITIANAQDPLTEKQISKLLNQLQSPNCAERCNAVIELRKLPSSLKTEDVKNALIQTFIREEPWIKDPKLQRTYCKELFETDDGLGLYIEEIEEALAELNDERVMPIFRRLKRFHMLAKLGDIEPIIIAANERDPTIGTLPLLALVRDLLKHKERWNAIPPETKKKVKKVMVNTIKDDNWRYRRLAVKGLGELAIKGDNDVIPILRKIAKEDPYSQDFSKKKNYTGPKKRYRVREEAQKVLDRLKKEGKIKE